MTCPAANGPKGRLAMRPDKRLPRLDGQGRVVGSVLTDALGAGMVEPVIFLYLTEATRMSMARVGLAMTAASVLSWPLGFVGGPLVDWFGPRAVLVANNALTALGYSLLVMCGSWTQVLLTLIVVQGTDRLYWSAWPVFVARLSSSSGSDAWLAFAEAAKGGCMGVGALVAAVLLALDHSHGAGLLMLLNVATCLIAGALLALSGPSRTAARRAAESPIATPARPAAQSRDQRGLAPADLRWTWRRLIRLRWIGPLFLAQLTLSFAWLVPVSVIPLLVVMVLHLGSWLVSVLFGTNCLCSLMFQTTVTTRVRGLRRTRTVFLSGMTAAAGMLLLAGAIALSAGEPGLRIVLVVAGSLLFGLAFMLFLPSSSALFAQAAPSGAEGRTASLFQTAWAFAACIGPALVGWLITWDPWALIAVLTLLILAGASGFVIAEPLLPEGVLRPAPALG